jgi:hypothetical protein
MPPVRPVKDGGLERAGGCPCLDVGSPGSGGGDGAGGAREDGVCRRRRDPALQRSVRQDHQQSDRPALFLLAVLGAQFTAGGIRPLSLGFLAFDVVVLYPLLVWLAKGDARGVDVLAEALSYRGFYVARPELRRPQGKRPLSAIVK